MCKWVEVCEWIEMKKRERGGEDERGERIRDRYRKEEIEG